jgi:transaldolase
VNITAVFHISQIENLLQTSKSQCIISIFAGRIADAGIDPELVVSQFRETEIGSNVDILWASVREPFNIIQAQRSGCDIITVQPELLIKARNFGRDLIEYSRETVQMFVNDAKSAGLKLEVD